MKLLPTTTLPWSDKIERRHNPQQARGRYGYRRYRPCLRWEFAFSCAFCLCHEADLVAHGTEGTGLTQIEHYEPAAQDEARINDYWNCFYICRFCNQARSTTPVHGKSGALLLNPAESCWRDHFFLVDDELHWDPHDRDATYTGLTYDLNDPRKLAMRKKRREILQESLDLLDRGTDLRDRLLEQSSKTAEPGFVELAQLIDELLRLAWRDLLQFQPIPADADSPCGCKEKNAQATLPGVLERQLLQVEPPDALKR